jgi:hypothetical protein
MMSLQDLVKLVPPPERPLGTCAPEEVRVFQESLGIEFPEDFIALGRLYGSGHFIVWDTQLNIKNVCDPAFQLKVEDEYEYLASLFEDEPQHRVFPERPGWFPWGDDINGNMYLVMVDDPGAGPLPMAVKKRDPIVDEQGEDQTLFIHDMQISTFLLKLVQGWNPHGVFYDDEPPTIVPVFVQEAYH